ncbi:MAG TPA: trypsin-like peptidase domain-containing protein [Streptosporangiaceae bacterium]|nr:trypsin-like peptidase domain-containing protein [Streptosporangiaceae bacterium]
MATLAVVGCSSGAGPLALSQGGATKLQSQYEHVVQHALLSVVEITTTSGSTGSGVVYDNHGDIVTNEHVIGAATSVNVVDAVGNNTFTAKVVGEFAPDDLAVIRVESNASALTPAAFANSNDARVGQIVLAMGNPLGLADSVTQGIISATGRTVRSGEPGGGKALITAAIQTSAAINPGNSGGALVNLAGQVIGIPTLAATLPGQGGLAPGIGFAIPTNTVKNIADQLIKSGKVTSSDRATLGITAHTAASESGTPAGVAVLAVDPGGTADNAGVRAGDIIVGINDQSVSSLQELQSALSLLTPGTTVTIKYTRGSSTVHQGSAKLASLGT